LHTNLKEQEFSLDTLLRFVTRVTNYFLFLAFSRIHNTQRVRNFWHCTVWQPSRAGPCYTCNR